MDEGRGFSLEPRGAVEHVGGAALDAIRAEAETRGVTVESVVILLDCEDVPAGEPNALTCGFLDDDEPPSGRELLTVLLAHAVSAARELGLDVRIVPMPGRG